MSKSVEERFLMCAQMYEDAKELASASVPDGFDEAEKDAYIFRRIHGATPIELIGR